MNAHERLNIDRVNPNDLSLETLYRKYYRKIVLFVGKTLNSNMFAEDIAQDVFIALYQQETHFMSERAFVNYIYRSAYNKCIDTLRRKQMMQRYEDIYLDEYASKSIGNTNTETLYDELFSIVENRIDKLPPKCRTIFSMKYRNEQTNPEISESLGLSLKTVENQVFIARNVLRDHLRPYLCL
jgi:RNA polymerase sigma-70 factor (ECF subfamily)